MSECVDCSGEFDEENIDICPECYSEKLQREEDEHFWWSQWGRKNLLKMELVVNFPLIWVGIALIIASHFTHSELVKYVLVSVGLIVLFVVTLMKYTEYKSHKEWLEENE